MKYCHQCERKFRYDTFRFCPYCGEKVQTFYPADDLRGRAEEGDSEAQYKMGICLDLGNSGKDPHEALTWWVKAAKQNNPKAQYELGICFHNGYFFEKDEEKAQEWWGRAVHGFQKEQGDADVQYMLGICYKKGRGIKKDATKARKCWHQAVELFRKDAEKGIADAQFMLGVCYARGEGIEKDEEEANKWYRKAAEQGYVGIQNRLVDTRKRDSHNRSVLEFMPNVDDGLNPIERRIIWKLYQMDNGLFQKVNNVTRAIMNYSPHGDGSIDYALVNLANKECFIDKQGSFGDIIRGVPESRPRWRECRLSKFGRDILFNNDITTYSYNGHNTEPVCLPSKIPTLLLLGADGLPFGTRTMIFPHNFNELLRAQISILKGEPFHIYPDFPQGGIIDVSDYQDGLGKIVLRARITAKKQDIVISEIHAATDTSKLMDSIESAVNKSRIKISSFHDYTADDKVNIKLSPQRGHSPEKAINDLYTYTDCQMSVSCMYMVTCDKRPIRMTASDILRRNNQKLVQHLTWELQIVAAKCIEKILARTLMQIFIEEKIYKKIETCKTKEAVVQTVRTGLERYKNEWLSLIHALHAAIEVGPHVLPPPPAETARIAQLAQGVIPDSEIQHLLEIPIPQIAAFNIQMTQEEITILQKDLRKVKRNLKNIRQYAISYIEGLLSKYGDKFPRRTEICFEPFK